MYKLTDNDCAFSNIRHPCRITVMGLPIHKQWICSIQYGDLDNNKQ